MFKIRIMIQLHHPIQSIRTNSDGYIIYHDGEEIMRFLSSEMAEFYLEKMGVTNDITSYHKYYFIEDESIIIPKEDIEKIIEFDRKNVILSARNIQYDLLLHDRITTTLNYRIDDYINKHKCNLSYNWYLSTVIRFYCVSIKIEEVFTAEERAQLFLLHLNQLSTKLNIKVDSFYDPGIGIFDVDTGLSTERCNQFGYNSITKSYTVV